MEYAHRMWGRLVGVAVLLPAAGFWAGGWLDKALKRRAVVYSGLVVAQGLLGWWMVKSGLQVKPAPTDVPRVSQYRLASHLGMALILYSSMLYTALGLLAPPTRVAAASRGLSRLRHVTHATTSLVFLTALSGQLSCLVLVVMMMRCCIRSICGRTRCRIGVQLLPKDGRWLGASRLVRVLPQNKELF